MQSTIFCFLLVLVSAAEAFEKKDWSDFSLPGCEGYSSQLMEKAQKTSAKENFKQCSVIKDKKERIPCIWDAVMGVVKDCDAPSETCWENVKKFFKMP